MLVQKELEKIFQELINHDHAQAFLSSFDVTIHAFDQGSKLSLVAPVYFGGNYIPNSVRLGVTKTPPFERSQTIKTSLTLDEEHYRVFLHYVGTTDSLNNQKFIRLLEDFCYLVNEWRIYLDEHDKNDLVYVKVK